MFGESPRNLWPQAKGLASLALVILAIGLAGCGTRSVNRAPVEDRGSSAGPLRPAGAGAAATPAPASPTGPLAPATTAAPSGAVVKMLPGAENEGKPGYYTVKTGDTLIRIGLDSGQHWRDIVRWNAIENPNQIEVGQVLRVVPPVPGTAIAGAVPAAPPATSGAAAAGAISSAASAPAGAASGVVTRPIATPSATPTAVPPASSSAQAAIAPRTAASGVVVATAPATAGAGAPSGAPSTGAASPPNPDEDIAWIWPSPGTVLAGFDEVKNKGLDIGGTAGAAVVAAADGRVVYVGAGLRGYGNLIILKHNSTYLTAYAHNQTLLVKEDQSVRRGQKIAEMGSSDTDRVKLHFEVRRQGKPVDPSKYLPPR